MFFPTIQGGEACAVQPVLDLPEDEYQTFFNVREEL